MIVRILHEGQYDISGVTLDEVHRLDDALLHEVESGDEAGFKGTLKSLLDVVRSGGQKLPDDMLKESQVVLPSSDFSLDEARKLFHP